MHINYTWMCIIIPQLCMGTSYYTIYHSKYNILCICTGHAASITCYLAVAKGYSSCSLCVCVCPVKIIFHVCLRLQAIVPTEKLNVWILLKTYGSKVIARNTV